jgi:hypothetical protein
MQQGFRVVGPFGPGLLVADDRSGFAAGIPRSTQLPIAPTERELPLDVWLRIDELPIKIGYRWFPTTTAGAPRELVEAAVNEIVLKRSLDQPQVGRAMADQLTRWNAEAAASAVFARTPPLLAMGSYGPADPDGFHMEEAMVLFRSDRGLMIVYKRFSPTMAPPDWAMFQSFVNASMVWDPVSYRVPTPPRERRSPFVRPGIRMALLPEREAELPMLAELMRREIKPGDKRLENFMWAMLQGSDALDGPVPPPDVMDMLLPTLTESPPVLARLQAHAAQLEVALDLKGMAMMYLRALGRNA